MEGPAQGEGPWSSQAHRDRKEEGGHQGLEEGDGG